MDTIQSKRPEQPEQPKQLKQSLQDLNLLNRFLFAEASEDREFLEILLEIIRWSTRRRQRREGEALGFEKGEASGFEKGEIKRSIEIAANMLKKNMDKADIAEMTGLSIEKIEAIQV